MAVFWRLFDLRCQLKKVEKEAIFGKNGKPIALLFGLKWLFLEAFLFAVPVEESVKEAIFGKNGKPIALLFRYKWLFFGSSFICGAS